MKLLVALCALICAATAAPSALPEGRIIGGVDALEGEFPQICIVQWVFLSASNNLCSCVVLNNNHVLTAAHCLDEAPGTGRLEIVGGVLDTTRTTVHEQRLRVLSTVLHPQFTNNPPVNDIAIIRTLTRFTYNPWIQPALLPVAGAVPTGATITAGWGVTSTGVLPQRPTHLQKIQAPVAAFADCASSIAQFGVTLHSSNMCTGPLTGGKGVCNGDSGGPVLQNGVLLGIISFATTPCAAVGGASVHVQVSNFIAWITANS